MRKIVHFTSVHTPFDVRVFHRECRSIAAAHYSIVYVVPHDRDLVQDGVTIRAIPKFSGRLARVLVTAWHAFRTALRENGDLYHFHDPELIGYALILKLLGKRVVYDVHEDVSGAILGGTRAHIPSALRIPLYAVVRALESLAGLVFDGIIVATPAIGRKFRSRKSVTVQNFPILSEYEHLSPPRYEDRAPTLIHTGIQSTRRGAIEMVDAIERIQASTPARLTLIGRFEPRSEQALLEKRPGWKQVRFLGWKSRAETLAETAASRVGLVLFHPSRNHDEAQPSKLFEYLACGIPVIASDFPHWRSLFEKYECCQFVDPKKTDEISSAMEGLLLNPEAAKRAGMRGRELVRTQLNWGNEERALLWLYRSILRPKVGVWTLSRFLLRHIGLRAILLRALYYLKRRLGVTARRFRSRSWNSITLPDASLVNRPFFFPFGVSPKVADSLSAMNSTRPNDLPTRIEFLKDGSVEAFFARALQAPIPGFEPSPPSPWCALSDYRPDQGDPRSLWEPSRAAWAFDLLRARARGGNRAELEALYWKWLDAWMDANPPFQGFQWKCGQESAVRLIALTFGLFGLSDPSSLSPNRRMKFAQLAWATGYRIYNEIAYALSQKNNHAFTEAAALILIGYLFPEFREAKRWKAKGRAVIESELRRQLYSDGSYIQQSFNYQRVMLEAALVAFRISELTGEPFDRTLYDLLDRSNKFLLSFSDLATGRTPNYGGNDGAWILPLSESEFADYRPTLQLVHWLCHRERLFSHGIHDEALQWIFGVLPPDSSRPAPPRREREAFRSGGYYKMVGRESWAMIRCHETPDRTVHCDQLHLDLWWKGENVLQDSGTYQYYFPKDQALEGYFKSSRAHNVITLDEEDPLAPVSRFLWVPGSRGRERRFDSLGLADRFEGESYDYARAPWNTLWRRSVLSVDTSRGSTLWAIVDDLDVTGRPARAALHWNLIDGRTLLNDSVLEAQIDAGKLWIEVTAPPGLNIERRLIRGQDGPTVLGFSSPYYGEIRPRPVLEVAASVTRFARFLTVIGLGEAISTSFLSPESAIITTASDRIEITFSPLTDPSAPIVLGVNHALDYRRLTRQSELSL